MSFRQSSYTLLLEQKHTKFQYIYIYIYIQYAINTEPIYNTYIYFNIQSTGK